MKPIITFLVFTLLLQGCKEKKPSTGNRVITKPVAMLNPEAILKVDLNQDLSRLSLQDLRLLRTSLYARQGYCIMEADLRGYFSVNMPAYDSIMELRFWYEEEYSEGVDSVPPIQFTPAENAFIASIDSYIKIRQKDNFTDATGRRLANVNNIVNLFQAKNLSQGFMQKLAQNNFVIVPDNQIQMFHLYEENDYQQMPNFITTDMYLQVFHTYFEYVLKSVEQEKFIPALVKLCDNLHAASMQQAATATDAEVKKAAEFNAVFFAIPYQILTGNKKTVPANMQALYNSEIQNINAEQDNSSQLLQFEDGFPYSLYKPRGHYTRKEEFKKYFKAMMWLQTAVMCREKEEQLKRATFMAALVNSSPAALQLYKSVFEPVVYLIGEPDNLSVLDICTVLQQNKVSSPASSIQPQIIAKVTTSLTALAESRNKIKPKREVSCPDKINFMPQRYLPDNEVLNNMVDTELDAERAYPKGLDVFDAFDAGVANDILMNEEKDAAKWNKFTQTQTAMRNKFGKYDNWNASTYNSWLEALMVLQKTEKNYPEFMQTREWGKKNLNTGLASWAELKHDAILYGEQPGAAECGGGGPPDPVCVGYVEPNVAFWKKMLQMISDMNGALIKAGVITEDVIDKNKEMSEHILAMLNISEKELKKEKLSEEEYKTIEIAGSTVEYLTLSIIEPGANFGNWSNVQGPDKSLAVVADVFTRNISGDSKNGILHEATGYVNSIYVVVEIDGYLYLTKGATFSYYEFLQPPNNRLTDEEWQLILEKGKVPPIPKWMEELIVPDKDAPLIDERIFYSSGC